MARSVGAWQAAGSRASRQATPHDELRQLAEWWRSKPHPSPATGGAIGVVSTARVQRGSSQTARSASTETIPNGLARSCLPTCLPSLHGRVA